MQIPEHVIANILNTWYGFVNVTIEKGVLVSKTEMRRGGIFETGERLIEAAKLDSLLRDRNPVLAVGYELDGELTPLVQLNDVIHPPLFLLRPRDDIPAYIQAANEHGLRWEIRPIYTKENAQQAAQRAAHYAIWSFISFGHTVKPQAFTPETLYKKGETKVEITITEPDDPNAGLSDSKHEAFAGRVQELLEQRDLRQQDNPVN